LAESTAKHENLKRLIAQLEREREAAEREQNNCVVDCASALAEALQSHPQVIALFEYHNQLRAELAATNEALMLIARRFDVPDQFRNWQAEFNGPVSYELRNKWQAAIEAYAKDCEAKLPSVE
jgi:hypothetical protein